MNNRNLNLLVLGIVLLLTLVVAYAMSGADFSGGEAPLRALGALALLAAMGIVVYLTRESEAWTLNVRTITNGAAGAMLYAVFLWLFSGALFSIPAVSDLALRPALIFPILFGYLFGPVAGVVAGGFGSVFGNGLAGTPVTPEWHMAAAAAGFVAGLRLVLPDRPRTLDIAAGIAAIIGVAATVVYRASPGLGDQITGQPFTAWLGYSTLGGVVAALALRYAFPEQEWATMLVWAALGILAGLGLAALTDLWVDAAQLGAASATVGRFIPAAGPSLVALVFFLPILLAGYEVVQQSQAT